MRIGVSFPTVEIGATHLSVSTGGKVFHTPQEHLDALRRFKHEVGL